MIIALMAMGLLAMSKTARQSKNPDVEIPGLLLVFLTQVLTRYGGTRDR